VKAINATTALSRLESGLGLESRLKSIFAGLGLGPGLGLGNFVTKSTFNFHCAHLQCFI